MATIRIIHYAGENNSSREGVYFTEDFDTDTEDFIPHGCKLVSDTEEELDLPSLFPLERQLESVF